MKFSHSHAGRPMDWIQGPWSVQLHTVHDATYQQLKIENRVFPYWIISFVKEGNLETTSGKSRYRVKAGDAMIHPPHIPFSEYSDGHGTHLWLQTNIWCSHQLDLLQLYRICRVVTVSDPVRYATEFHKLLSVWNDHDAAFRDMKLTSAMLQLLELVLTGWERMGCPESSEAMEASGYRFARLVGEMSMRMHEKITREELAESIRLNANYMDRAFQRYYRMTPMQMLREMRLKRAKQLLEQTNDTLESIAAQCGMTDASYLIKQYKHRYEALPGEYREQYRQLQAEDLYGGGK